MYGGPCGLFMKRQSRLRYEITFITILSELAVMQQSKMDVKYVLQKKQYICDETLRKVQQQQSLSHFPVRSKILDFILSNRRSLYNQSFASLLLAYKKCGQCKNPYAKLQAQWLQISQKILDEQTKNSACTLFSQHEVRIVGNMILHALFEIFNKVLTNRKEKASPSSSEIKDDDTNLLKRLVGSAVRRYKAVIKKSKREKNRLKIVDKIYTITEKNGMTISEKNLVGIFPTTEEEFINIISEMAKKLQSILNPSSFKSLGKNAYMEVKTQILNDKFIQKAMMNYAINLHENVGESIDECYKTVRILMLKCLNGRINAFHINQRAGVTLMLRDNLKHFAVNKKGKSK